MPHSLRRLQIISLVLTVLGVGFVAYGLKQEWTPKHPALLSANRYLIAIQSGNQNGLLNELSQDARSDWVQTHGHAHSMQALPDFSYQVKSAKIQSNVATITLEIRHARYKIRPVLIYGKQQNGSWKINEIVDLKPDPALARAIQRSHDANEKLVETQLRLQLADQPGIEIRR